MSAAVSKQSRVGPRLIRASLAVYGAGPGMGGVVYLEFKLRGSAYEAFLGGDAGGRFREFVAECLIEDGWRGRVRIAVGPAEPAHEDHRTSEVTVCGARQPERELLQLAWSGPAGAAAARLLLALTDAELAELARRQLLNDEASNVLGSLLEEVEEADVIADLKAAVGEGSFSWETLTSRVQRSEAIRETADSAERERVSAVLAPYADHIAALLAAWDRLQPPASGNSRWLAGAKRSAVKGHIERAFIETGKPPAGQNRITINFMGRQVGIDFDADALRSGND